jgi:hypothetical protein
MHTRTLLRVAFAIASLNLTAAAQLNGPFVGAEQARLGLASPVFTDALGATLDVDGDTAVLGNPSSASSGLSQAGAALVFSRTGAAWSQQATLVSLDLESGDRFAGAVAIDGDTLVAGAVGKVLAGVGRAGAAYVFVRSGSSWTQQHKLVASDAALFDNFGYSVALSGDTLLVAANADDVNNIINAGSVYVFVRAGGAWTQQSKLSASDAGFGEQFGQVVALDGDTALIGAPFDNHPPFLSGAGSAYVFVRSNGAWTQQQKLLAFDAAPFDTFGYSVALSGDTALVGAPADDHSGFSDAGSAYAYTRSGSTWTLQQKLTSLAPGVDQNSGNAVALSGSVALVAQSSVDNIDPSDPGAVYAYSRSGATWSYETTLWPGDAANGDEFGAAVALDGTTALVGSLETLPVGAGYVFELQTSPALYCTAKTNSQGCAPTLSTSGAPSATSPAPFQINASSVLNQKIGLLFYGFEPANAPFQDGWICIQPPTTRTTPQSSGGTPAPDNCSGSYSFDFNALIRSGADPLLVVGRDVFAQYWSRDPAYNGVKTGLTSAAHFAIQP